MFHMKHCPVTRKLSGLCFATIFMRKIDALHIRCQNAQNPIEILERTKIDSHSSLRAAHIDFDPRIEAITQLVGHGI
eukprot:TRINITY_DN22766_c0_g1_i1.p1 TRINITY_DN22766_c0_g1~~TRINITY_DN22766_c0_g1_i1.p1  ORF type:complete len:77 (+),score=3.85 TRINITY_DN22766_c0_g1_i1:202-432(+)